jgi:hypothetical protein
MRRTMLAIAIGACTRADEPKPPPTPAVVPVAPKPPPSPVDSVDHEAELAKLAKQLVHVSSSAVGCTFVVSSSHESKRTIPLDKVTWTLDPSGRRVLATCKPQGDCIWTMSESHTTDLPHQYSQHHEQVDWDKLLVAADVKEPAKLVAELDRAKRFCKRP